MDKNNMAKMAIIDIGGVNTQSQTMPVVATTS